MSITIQSCVLCTTRINYIMEPMHYSNSVTVHFLDLKSAFTVRIWGGEADKFRLIIEWKVHLPSLKYLGDQVCLCICTHYIFKDPVPVHLHVPLKSFSSL